jgi:competence protein ComGC
MNIWQNLNKDENGFLHIELLILMAILSSVAMIYICMGILRNQQLNNGYRMTAIYLAQGYLNLMEEQKANIIPNQIECNGMKYIIKQKEIFQDDIDEISIEISWRYHDQEEMEYQEREIKREVIK